MSCVRGPRPPVNCCESATINEVGVGDGMAGRAEGGTPSPTRDNIISGTTADCS